MSENIIKQVNAYYTKRISEFGATPKGVDWNGEDSQFMRFSQLMKIADGFNDQFSLLDFGCGYGYLSYYLHYKSKKRNIIASDYDETKITVAANGMHLNTNLHFLTADIRSQTIKPFTLALVNDVLHYLTPKEQQEFLVKLGANCSDGGTILIRDGEVQQSANLKRTQLTEWLSTKVFKFNKTSNSLNFISSEEINKFALNNNFSLEKKLHSKFTSNVLWILKKQA